MNKIRTLARLVATEPIKEKAMTVSITSGFASVNEKVSLTPLKIIFDTEIDGIKLKKGMKVHVRGDSFAMPWNKIVYEVGEESFVLIPFESVILYEEKE